MSAKHTPGPWVAGFTNLEGHENEIRPAPMSKGWSSGYAPIARVVGDKRITSSEERLANARLIAAAPRQNDALLAVLHAPGFDALDEATKNAVRSALAAAKGEA